MGTIGTVAGLYPTCCLLGNQIWAQLGQWQDCIQHVVSLETRDGHNWDSGRIVSNMLSPWKPEMGTIGTVAGLYPTCCLLGNQRWGQLGQWQDCIQHVVSLETRDGHNWDSGRIVSNLL